MKSNISAFVLAAALSLSGAALAQVPSGGADAKGNAPLKHAHTIDDGAAKAGRTSFTQKQAQRHIEHAGYTSVSGLTKGRDGVWRGTATKDGTPRPVGLDFKGNVSEGAAPTVPNGGPAGGPTMADSTGAAGATTTTASSAETTTSTTTGAAHHRRAHHHRRRHHAAAAGRCAAAAAEGAACSGVDKNRNGVSDKEDRGARTGIPR